MTAAPGYFDQGHTEGVSMATFLKKGLLFAVAACTMGNPVLAQAESGQDVSRQSGGDGVDSKRENGASDSVDGRVQRQHWRISHALKVGLITQDQSTDLKRNVDDIAAQVKQLRQQNGGTLKPEDLKQIENSLNQSSDQIRTVAESGHAEVQSGKVLGATWSKGPDGAQNPKELLKKMKQENNRELRQERQSSEQKLEQQQLQYEREMVEHLGEQKQNILQQKDELKDVRKESGAD
jgi:hypothetical protein